MATSNTSSIQMSQLPILAIAGSFLLGCSFATAASWIYREKHSNAAGASSMTKNEGSFTVEKSRQSSSESTTSAPSKPSKSSSCILPPEIRAEQLSRHQLYFGDEGMEALRKARICVVGLGGVGSHTAHMLARAGVGMMRLIDFDQVTVSSLNRHAVASLQDVGTPKASCLANFIRLHICPDKNHLKLETFVEMYTAESAERLLKLPDEVKNPYDWTMVIDCIDDIPTKAVLLQQCLKHNIRVVSCMGAGGKADFTRLHWSDLRTASKDPLATKLRQTLKQLLNKDNDMNGTNETKNGRTHNDYLDNMDRLSVLFSSEKTVVKLADFTEEQKEESSDGFHRYGAVDGMRIRVIPVLGTMPAIFGSALATICLTVTAGKEIQPVTGERIGRNVRNRIYQHLKSREQRIMKQILHEAQLTEPPPLVDDNGGCLVNGVYISTAIQIDQEDVEYLMETWRNRCAVTGARLGTVLELVRWDLSKPATCPNLVLVSVNVISKFDVSNIEQGKASIDLTTRLQIEQRLRSCRLDAWA